MAVRLLSLRLEGEQKLRQKAGCFPFRSGGTEGGSEGIADSDSVRVTYEFCGLCSMQLWGGEITQCDYVREKVARPMFDWHGATHRSTRPGTASPPPWSPAFGA